MSSKLFNVTLNTDQPVIVKKWKIKQGMTVATRQVIFFYEHQTDKLLQKYKATHAGSVQKLCIDEGALVKPGEVLLILEECSHPTVMSDMCAECGADLRQAENRSVVASVPMVHSIPELKVSEEQAQTLGKADEARLLADRKLVLLVDLDQTVIHTTNDNIPPNLKDVVHFQLYGPQSPWYHTRIRPGTNHFLAAVSTMYELHICTFGARNYAHYIAMFLDPDGRFFSHRILSRDECFDANSKTANLKALFPCGDSMVCIIDDREDVWNYAPNLIHVKPYHFFQHTGDINAPPGLTKKENDSIEEGFDFASLGKTKQELTSIEEGKKQEKILNRSGETTTDKDTEDEVENKPGKISKRPSVIEEKSDGTADWSSDTAVSKTQNDNDYSVIEQDEDLSSKVDVLNIQMTEGEGVDQESKEIDDSKCEEDLKISKIVAEEDDEVKEKSGESTESCKKVKNTEEDDDSKKSGESSENYKKVNDAEEDNDVKEKSGEVSENCKKVKDAEEDKEKSGESSENCKKVKDVEEDDNIEKSGEISENCNEVKDAEKDDDVKEKSGECSENCKTVKDGGQVENAEGLIEVEDTDDYLLFLEEILRKIHTCYYSELDEKRAKIANAPLPDLKVVVPAVKREVLAGCHLVLSGLVPSHVPLQRSRAYMVAVSLGATVEAEVGPMTTHLVAARAGTAKVNSSRRQKGVVVVTPQWLWSCAERWEKVDERLFPLARGVVTNRHPPAHCGSPPHPGDVEEPSLPPRLSTDSGRFSDSINPLLTLSSEEVASMDEEVEALCRSDDSDSDAAPQEISKSVLPVPEQEDSSTSQDSLSGRAPKGWCEDGVKKRKRKIDTTTCTESDLEEDSPSVKFRRGEPLPSDLDLGENSQDTQSSQELDLNDDADWTLMGAALEREFLSGD